MYSIELAIYASRRELNSALQQVGASQDVIDVANGEGSAFLCPEPYPFDPAWSNQAPKVGWAFYSMTFFPALERILVVHEIGLMWLEMTGRHRLAL
jgi:hypothetical protein